MKNVHFLNQTLPVQENLSVEEIKTSLSSLFPEIANATASIATNGDITFTVQSGTKG